VIALTFLAAIASDSWGQSQRKSPPREETKATQQSTAIDQRGTEQSPAIVKIIPTPKTAEETETDRKEREDKNKSDWWLVKLTGALAIIGALQLFVFGYQAIQLKRTVIATKEAADALPNIERAYVFVDPELEPWDPVTDPSYGVYNSRYSVKFSIQNHGKTPAVIKLIDARLKVLSEAPDNSLGMASLLPDKVLRAGESFIPDLSPRNCEVDRDTAVELQNNRAQIWFYGSIWYDDMFGKEHITRFRWCLSEIFDTFIPRGDAPYNERT
jgi:hypothetical protein